MKPGWYVLGGLAAAALLWFGAPAAGRRMAFFQVRRVEVRGSRYLPAERVVAALKLPVKSTVFDRFDSAAARVRALPGVKAAAVSRRFPGSVVVTVEERAAAGLVPAKDGLRIVDETGRALPWDASRSAPDLPVLEAADSLVAGLLVRVREADPAFFGEVQAAWRVRDDVVLQVAGHRIWFRPDAGPEELRAVQLVAQDLARKGRQWAELDGRFRDMVVVRREAA